VSCPYCRAEPGEACRGTDGSERTAHHQQRVDRAVAASGWSPPDRQPPRELVLMIACPECGAPAGEPCVGAREHSRVRTHIGRAEAARGLLDADPMGRY
jgi:hypothetical protein